MKPQEHISTERWRHEDAALRRALQQRNEVLPQLPEGFAEKIVAQLPEGMPAQEPKQSAADLNTPSSKRAHSLLLWPMTAAAAVIAALFISLPSLIHKHPDHDEVAKAPERSTIISTPDHPERPAQAPEHPAITSTPDHPLMAQATRHPSSTNRFPQSEPSAAPTSEVTTLQSETSASQISRVTTAPQSEASATPTSEVTTAPQSDTSQTQISENIPQTETTPTPVVGGISSNTPSTSPSLPAATSSPRNFHITLTFSPTAAGTDLALNDTYNHSASHSYENPATTSADTYHSYDDKYYIPAGDGYTYAEHSSASSSDHSGNTRSAPLRHIEKAEALNKSKHSLPFTASLMVNIPLTERLALETGLSYSRLHSTFDQGNVTFYQHTQQTLHYLGLPLHLHYSFISRNRWRFYGLAGLQVDFPVSTTAEITHQAPYGSSTPTTEHLSAPVQFAPVIGLGAQLNLSRHAALFVQPSLQWYIHTGSSIKTYRSEHPLTFAIPFGFRWTL